MKPLFHKKRRRRRDEEKENTLGGSEEGFMVARDLGGARFAANRWNRFTQSIHVVVILERRGW